MSGNSTRDVAKLARGQHGVVARAQLRTAGWTPSAIKTGVRTGRLRRIHRGVYGVGPIELPRAHVMAAVLAYGARAAVSHWSAAELYGLVRDGSVSRPIHVSMPTRGLVARAGIRLWQGRLLNPDELSVRDGLPVTRIGRTLVDLAALARLAVLERAVARADRDRLIDTADLGELLRRYAGRPGIRALRTVLTERGGPAFTRSAAEERFLASVRRAGLPRPEVNVMLDGYEIDFLWREARVAVEVDGYRYHSSRASFESDRRRATELAARGVQTIPITWRQLVSDELATLVRIGQALAHASGRLHAPTAAGPGR